MSSDSIPIRLRVSAHPQSKILNEDFSWILWNALADRDTRAFPDHLQFAPTRLRTLESVSDTGNYGIIRNESRHIVINEFGRAGHVRCDDGSVAKHCFDDR